jgi:hypothetical protein
MPPEKPSFVKVDELMPKVSLEQAAQFYGIPLPELHRTGQETRMKCFLNCGRAQETGSRVLAIQEQHPAKRWACHEYGCGKNGNFVGLCDLMKPGENAGGRPRDERFRAIALDLQAMAGGTLPTTRPSVTPPQVKVAAPAPPETNVPLAKSPNERARALVTLDAKFTTDLAGMPPPASAYLRRRPFLTPEVLRAWRVGYLPRDAGGDTSGGTMRGKIVYPYHSADGELLTWFGRDPDYEAKHRQWEATDRSGREPEKFHFVKGFHRGLELYGQERVRDPAAQDALKRFGVVICEGPNDVIRLSTLGVPAVGLCSNRITREQAAKVADLATGVGGGIATIFLDCDTEGESGMKQALGYLAQLVPVRLAWTSGMHGERFKSRQPESLTPEEWAEIAAFLTRTPVAPSPIVPDPPPPAPDAEPTPWDFV